MNILKTQDLEDRIVELEAERLTWLDSLTQEDKETLARSLLVTNEELTDQDFQEEWESSIDGNELKNLLELREDIGRSWAENVSLVPDSEFEEFAQQEADSLGLISDKNSWPTCYINWEFAAESLKQDYSTVDYDGETYYYRE